MKVSFSFDSNMGQAAIVAAIGAFFAGTATPGGPLMDYADRPDVGGAPSSSGISPGPADMDASGIPWDARIHSSSKEKTAANVWRLKRGANPAEVATVTAELKARGTGAAVTTTGYVPAGCPLTADEYTTYMQGKPQSYTPEKMAWVMADAAKGQQNPPGLPPPPPALGNLPPPPLVMVNPFTQFVDLLVAHTQSPTNPTGRLTEQYINDMMKHYGAVDANGVGSVQALAARPDLIATVRAGFCQALGIEA